MGSGAPPSPTDLTYFLEVAATSNVSRAAERLGVSQPTLSLAIRRLERDLGADLFLRSRVGVRLTGAGRRLQAQTKSLLHEWDKVRADAIRDESELRGRFTVGCHVSVALYSMHHLLPYLLEHYPALELRMVHDLSRRITEDIISFKVDFGIVVNPWEHPDLVLKTLWRDEVTLWTRTEPTKLQCPISGEGVLLCDPDLAQSQQLLKLMAKKGWRFPRVVPTPSLEVIAALVAEGAGVGILPGGVARRVPALGLRPLSPDAPKYPDRICLTYRADAQRARPARELGRTMERLLREGFARRAPSAEV